MEAIKSTAATAYRNAIRNNVFYTDWKAKPLWKQEPQRPVSSNTIRSHQDWPSFDPLMKLQQPTHIRCIAQWLCRFPSDILLCYPILEGIPLGIVLQLSDSLNNATNKFDHCITGRKEYQLVFPSTEQLANLRNACLFLHELRLTLGLAPNPPGSPLAFTANELAQWKPPNFRAIQIYLVKAIERILTSPTGRAYSNVAGQDVEAGTRDLQRYLKVQCQQDWSPQTSDTASSSIAHLKGALVWTETRYKPIRIRRFEPICALRAQQMACMAELVEEYPELLKKSSDPSPEPRLNWKHLVNSLKRNALRPSLYAQGKIHQHGVDQGCFHGAQFFSDDIFPLVPSDKSLALFVVGISKILPFLPRELAEIVAPDRSSESKKDSTQNSSSVRLFATPFSKLCLRVDEGVYPPNVLKDIRTAVNGMAFVHTKPDSDTGIKPRVLRTRWTPWSTEPCRGRYPTSEPLDQAASPFDSFQFLGHRPIFLSPLYPHLDILPPSKLDKRCIRFYTRTYRTLYPHQEIEWLKGFCRTVKFLEKVMDYAVNPAYQQATVRTEIR